MSMRCLNAQYKIFNGLKENEEKDAKIITLLDSGASVDLYEQSIRTLLPGTEVKLDGDSIVTIKQGKGELKLNKFGIISRFYPDLKKNKIYVQNSPAFPCKFDDKTDINSARATAACGVGTVITPINPETGEKMGPDKVYSYNNKVELKLKDGAGGIPFLVDIGAKAARELVRKKGARLVNFYTGEKYNHRKDLQTVMNGMYSNFKHGQTMAKGQDAPEDVDDSM